MPAVRRPRLPEHNQPAEPTVAAGAPRRGRAAPDLRPGRHHQPRHHGPRPAAARVRCGQAARRHRPALRAARRTAAGAGWQHLRTRSDGHGDRRPLRRDQPRRHHGRCRHRMHRNHHRRGARDRPVRSQAHRGQRTPAWHRERRAHPVRARRRPGHGPAGHGIRHPADPRAVRRRGQHADRGWIAAGAATAVQLSARSTSRPGA